MLRNNNANVLLREAHRNGVIDPEELTKAILVYVSVSFVYLLVVVPVWYPAEIIGRPMPVRYPFGKHMHGSFEKRTQVIITIAMTLAAVALTRYYVRHRLEIDLTGYELDINLRVGLLIFNVFGYFDILYCIQFGAKFSIITICRFPSLCYTLSTVLMFLYKINHTY